jgi:hypothetical protein
VDVGVAKTRALAPRHVMATRASLAVDRPPPATSASAVANMVIGPRIAVASQRVRPTSRKLKKTRSPRC